MRVAAILSGLILAIGTPATAQTPSPTFETDPFAELSPSRQARAPAPGHAPAFRLIAEIPLAGPLAGGPRWVERGVEIDLPSGTVLVEPVSGAIPSMLDASSRSGDGPPAELWVPDPEGRRRFRAVPPDRLVAEKRRSRGFRKTWRISNPGLSMNPPLVTEERVCFGGNDNRVTCVKPRNGHRVFSVDVGGRVTRRLVAAPIAGGALSLVLVVLEEGAGLVALSDVDGIAVSKLDFAEEDRRIIDVPAVNREGGVAIALQGYDPALAMLRIYMLDPPMPSTPRTTTSG